MSRVWTRYLAGAAFALTAAAGAAAYAQSEPAQAEHQAQADAARAPHVERHEERRIVIQDGDRHFEMMSGHHMDMTEHLRTMLQLKPGQEAALTAYMAAMKPAHDHDHDHVTQMADHDEKAKDTNARLADMEKHMAESQAQAHARIEATRKFYNQLEPSQKKVFDEMPMLMIGPFGPYGPMMMPGGMKMMVKMDHMEGMHHMDDMHRMPPMPPVPPVPPVPPRS
jgi:hypothetical protein